MSLEQKIQKILEEFRERFIRNGIVDCSGIVAEEFLSSSLRKIAEESVEDIEKRIKERIAGIPSWQVSTQSYQGLSEALDIISKLRIPREKS